MNFITTYPYLIFSLILLIFFSCTLVFSQQKHRKTILLSAVLSAPTSVATFIFVPYYWYPKRIVPFELGPEDILFSFSTGGIIWLMILLFLQESIKYEVKSKYIIKRYSAILFIGTTFYIVLLLTRMNIMLATLITISMLGCWILYKYRDYWPLCLLGAVSFLIFYTVYIKLSFVLIPGFLMHWNLNELYGIYVFGIPAEEMLWAFATGAVWPLIMAYLLNVQVTGKINSIKSFAILKRSHT